MSNGMQESRPGVGHPQSRIRLAFVLALLLCLVSTGQSQPLPALADGNLDAILAYIRSGWDSLTRSTSSCSGVLDPKLATSPVIYLPADFPTPQALEQMQRECKVTVARLPHVIHQMGTTDMEGIQPPGLLYLENKYVVPGGRFNEMYGWDSYFIILGLLKDGRIDLARGMVENFLFEIAHYGTILNANRTYYLSRSQPPFLTSMILAVYEAEKAAGHADRKWLERAYGYAASDYEMWNREPHLAGDTGLARYFDFGEGPVAEGLQDEAGVYRAAATYFVTHPEAADHNLIEITPGQPNRDAIGFSFTLKLCEATQDGNKCDPVRRLSLSRDFYKGD